MIKRKILIFIFSMLTIVSLIGQISASFSSLGITNEFQNGVVDIEIGEKTRNNETTPQVVMPHDEIYYCKTITNNGTDCYVRVKLSFSNQRIGNEATISGISSDWVQKDDGYYYYSKILNSGETINIFNSIRLGEIDESFQLSNFEIGIIVDAIQSKNFVTDFNSETPWGEVEIMKTDVSNTNITEYQPLPDTEFKVIYHDDVKGLIRNFDRFFCDINVLMPGDIYTDTLELKNDANMMQTIYFSTTNTMNKTFLDKVIFEISTEDNETIFKGTLGENQEIELATLNPNSNCKIKFKIEVPTEINNEFALNESSVKWTFSTEHITDSPQTGDNSHIGLYAVLMIVSIIGLILSIKGIKKHD